MDHHVIGPVTLQNQNHGQSMNNKMMCMGLLPIGTERKAICPSIRTLIVSLGLTLTLSVVDQIRRSRKTKRMLLSAAETDDLVHGLHGLMQQYSLACDTRIL